MGKRGPQPTSSRATKERMGNISIVKGSTTEGIPVVMWDAIPECDVHHCQIAATCPYIEEGKLCGVRKEYLDYVYRYFIGSVKSEDKAALFRIGFELIPLFGHLVSLKIANHGRPVTDKGSVQVNPLFREIRETIRSINLNINDLAESFSRDFGKGGEGDDVLGNTGYYDKLFEGEAPKVIRKTRNRV